MRQHQRAAGGQCGGQCRDDCVRIVLIGDAVQDGDQHQCDRPAKVQGLGRAGQDGGRVPNVTVEVGGGAGGATGQQRPCVRQHDRVVVDVDDPGVGGDPLRDLVGVVGRR